MGQGVRWRSQAALGQGCRGLSLPSELSQGRWYLDKKYTGREQAEPGSLHKGRGIHGQKDFTQRTKITEETAARAPCRN